MTFSDPQIKLLSGKLNDKHVKTRELCGRTLSYVEGWHVIAEANRVFGFDSWDRETVSAECVWSEAKREPKMCAYAARVRIRVRAGETIVCREGSGVGHGAGSTLGEAHESALKEAETDAMKRAFATFGNLFGLALYDKEQNGVRRRAAKPVGLRAIEWIVRSASGECTSTHRKPEAFCTALREVVTSGSSLADLNGIWARNTDTIHQMRIVCPDLQTASGAHYADVLEKLYRQRCEILDPGADPSPVREAVQPALENPVHPIPVSKRLRDDAHLRYVATLPCLVCGRAPTQAHHLRFAQPRALGRKVSDEWTVPLCLLHHRALHDVGDEKSWWEAHGIAAETVARELWTGRRDAGSNVIVLDPAREDAVLDGARNAEGEKCTQSDVMKSS
jgi:hypothetical protein